MAISEADATLLTVGVHPDRKAAAQRVAQGYLDGIEADEGLALIDTTHEDQQFGNFRCRCARCRANDKLRAAFKDSSDA